jgi:Histidine kinase
VLAHSLAAVSVNLEAAEALLGALPAGRPELAQAIECVTRAGAFTREGLADARRAILALRNDAAPLSQQLAELVKEYGAGGDGGRCRCGSGSGPRRSPCRGPSAAGLRSSGDHG